MKEQPSMFQWIIELLGIMLSAAGVLFFVVTIYTFPFLVLGFVYKVPPIVHVLMDYNQDMGLEHILSDKIWVLLVFVALVTILFSLSKILNNLLEKQIRRLAMRERRQLGYHTFLAIMGQFALYLIIAVFLFSIIFHI